MRIKRQLNEKTAGHLAARPVDVILWAMENENANTALVPVMAYLRWSEDD